MQRTITPLKTMAVLGLAVVLPVLQGHAAALIDLGATSGSGYSSNASANTSNTATVNSALNTKKDVKAGVNVDANTKVDTNTNTSAGVNANSSTNTAINASSHIFDNGEKVQVLRRNVEASVSSKSSENANANANINATLVPSSISSSEDLKAYANERMKADANIDDMNFTKDSIELGYKEHGKLLGVFPVLMSLKATAHADGRVEVSYPWYAFIVSKAKADLETKLKAAIQDSISTSANANANLGASASSSASEAMMSAGFNASQAAYIAERMHAILKDRFDANATASASENTDTNGSVSY